MRREFRECLSCGQTRLWCDGKLHSAIDECPRCGYLGWASPTSLTERMRQLFREQPPERRAAV